MIYRQPCTKKTKTKKITKNTLGFCKHDKISNLNNVDIFQEVTCGSVYESTTR
jgi:hypothetical protein